MVIINLIEFILEGCPFVKECIIKHPRYVDMCTCGACDIGLKESKLSSEGNNRVICPHCPEEFLMRIFTGDDTKDKIILNKLLIAREL